MSKFKPPWWQLPAIIGSCLVGVGAIGAGIVRLASFLMMGDRVEAVEKKNVQQDDDIIDLKGIAKEIQGYTKAMNQQRQRLPLEPSLPDTSEPWVSQTPDGKWWCCTVDRCDPYDSQRGCT